MEEVMVCTEVAEEVGEAEVAGEVEEDVGVVDGVVRTTEGGGTLTTGGMILFTM
jgi:hypothetical protein